MTYDDTLSRAQKSATRQRNADIAKCLDHGPTRRVLAQLIDGCGVFSYPVLGEGSEYREGRRSVGLDIVAMLQAVEPMAFIALQKEIVAERQKRDSDVAQEAEADDVY